MNVKSCSIEHIESINVKDLLTIETFYVRPPVNNKEILNDLNWCRREDRPVKADLTDWDVKDYFPNLCSQIHVLYPNHFIQDLWVASYGCGDYSETHNHTDFDWSFVWYLDACTECSPLIFPNLKQPWLPGEVIHPKVGNLHVFHCDRMHYVPPHTCSHERVVVSGNLKRKPEEPEFRNPFI